MVLLACCFCPFTVKVDEGGGFAFLGNVVAAFHGGVETCFFFQLAAGGGELVLFIFGTVDVL